MRHSTFTGPSPEAEANFAKVVAIAEDYLKPHREKLDWILRAVAEAHQLTPEDVTRAGKTRRLMAAKRDAALLTVETLCPPFSQGGICDWLNLARASLCRQLADARKRVANEPAYAEHLNILRARIRTFKNATMAVRPEDVPFRRAAP